MDPTNKSVRLFILFYPFYDLMCFLPAGNKDAILCFPLALPPPLSGILLEKLAEFKLQYAKDGKYKPYT